MWVKLSIPSKGAHRPANKESFHAKISQHATMQILLGAGHASMIMQSPP